MGSIGSSAATAATEGLKKIEWHCLVRLEDESGGWVRAEQCEPAAGMYVGGTEEEGVGSSQQRVDERGVLWREVQGFAEVAQGLGLLAAEVGKQADTNTAQQWLPPVTAREDSVSVF